MAKLKTGRHTGALKAHRQSERKASHNRGVRKQMRASAKEFTEKATAKSGDAAELLSKAASCWDKAAKKGVIHWKTAARKKSRMAKLLAKSTASK